MKNIKFILTFSLCFLLLSCNSDDESNDSGIVGSWNLLSLDSTVNTSTTRADGTTFSYNTTGVGRDLEYTVTFSKISNSVIYDGMVYIDWTKDHGDGAIFETSTGGGGTHTKTWSIEGDLITTTAENGTQNFYTINVLDNTTLIYTYNSTRERNINGNLEITTIEEVNTFSRL